MNTPSLVESPSPPLSWGTTCWALHTWGQTNRAGRVAPGVGTGVEPAGQSWAGHGLDGVQVAFLLDGWGHCVTLGIPWKCCRCWEQRPEELRESKGSECASLQGARPCCGH